MNDMNTQKIKGINNLDNLFLKKSISESFLFKSKTVLRSHTNVYEPLTQTFI